MEANKIEEIQESLGCFKEDIEVNAKQIRKEQEDIEVNAKQIRKEQEDIEKRLTKVETSFAELEGVETGIEPNSDDRNRGNNSSELQKQASWFDERYNSILGQAEAYRATQKSTQDENNSDPHGDDTPFGSELGSQKQASWFQRKWDNFKNNEWNFLRTLAWDKAYNHSFWKKLKHTFYIFFGDLPYRDKDEVHVYQRGFLDWVGGFFSKKLLDKCFKLWDEQDDGEDSEFLQKPGVVKSLIALMSCVMVPLLILQAIVALALTIVVSPIVAIFDIFVGPNFRSLERNIEAEIMPSRQSFWFNPSTWAMVGVVIVFTISLLMHWMNPAVFGVVAASLGVIQAVCVGMAAVLLTLSVFRFLYEVGVVFSGAQEHTHRKNHKGQLLSYGYIYNSDDSHEFILFGLRVKLLVYLKTRWVWMYHHPRTSVLVGGLGVFLSAFAIALTIAFFVGVPADSFVSSLFDFMSHTLVSLIQAMSHLSGLGFLGAPEAVLLPIAHVLSAIFFIAAPGLIADSILRYLQDNDEEGSLKLEEPLDDNSESVLKFYPKDTLPIDEYSPVFHKIAEEGEAIGKWIIKDPKLENLSAGLIAMRADLNDLKANGHNSL